MTGRTAAKQLAKLGPGAERRTCIGSYNRTLYGAQVVLGSKAIKAFARNMSLRWVSCHCTKCFLAYETASMDLRALANSIYSCSRSSNSSVLCNGRDIGIINAGVERGVSVPSSYGVRPYSRYTMQGLLYSCDVRVPPLLSVYL